MLQKQGFQKPLNALIDKTQWLSMSFLLSSHPGALESFTSTPLFKSVPHLLHQRDLAGLCGSN